eukprot:6975140-Prymnesium_polylepis.1
MLRPRPWSACNTSQVATALEPRRSPVGRPRRQCAVVLPQPVASGRQRSPARAQCTMEFITPAYRKKATKRVNALLTSKWKCSAVESESPTPKRHWFFGFRANRLRHRFSPHLAGIEYAPPRHTSRRPRRAGLHRKSTDRARHLLSALALVRHAAIAPRSKP